MKFNKSILAVATLSLMLSACATTPEDPNAKAKKGALIGAASGAAAGYLIGRNTAGALIGAAVGTAAGAGIGHYQDKQEAALRKQLQGSGVDVVRQGDNIMLDMPSGITFGFNSSDVNAQFYPVLDKVAATLNEYNQTTINVVGHTDSIGSDAVNQRLSEQRASSVAQYLQSRGVASQRLQTSGYGKTRPVDSNDTEAGRANNRRVEITLVPITQ
ncbi:MAG: OmpA family protein [Arenimonas sp.]|nr:OmpA family protein [Arenimonas sp.]MBP6309870.1 OmpA family protein [Arenimonas sp.]